MYNPDFSPPPEIQRPLWRSLIINFADRFAPERLAPLQLTSKPIDVILPADSIEQPWYRTVFTNIGDVISPERLPPLELESSPVDVGELPADELSHAWWDSLLQTLRDRLAAERLPALNLTSQPVEGFGAESTLQILDWSDLIAGPKVFEPDQPSPLSAAVTVAGPEAPVREAKTANPALLTARMQLVRDIGRTCFRRKIWIGLAAAEAVFLLVAIFKFQ
ncbi:MAG TPA: hypothetical protein VFB04_06130 [Terriglobales bacterium]|nr:hypothetical protein [Terriglobales bacterium]